MRNIIKKKKNVYFSNMKKIIKHYPMTDRLIVRRGYRFDCLYSLLDLCRLRYAQNQCPKQLYEQNEDLK